MFSEHINKKWFWKEKFGLKAEMDMKNKKKTDGRFCAAFILGMLFCVLVLGRTGLAAGETHQGEEQMFDIEAYLLSSDDNTYDIQLTLRNQGADWEGIVRVQTERDYDYLSCAYDTVIALPQGSTKQFVVRIPHNSIEDRDGTIKVSLLNHNKSGSVAAEKSFKRLLLDEADALSIGILSDSYRSLTYLDLGGETIYYGGIEYPIRLMQLDQDNLAGSLDFLKYIVIDNYNTNILTDEAIENIRQWVNDGGMLIVGTGEYAEDTLGGLDFLDVKCDKVHEPGNGIYGGEGLGQLALAELEDTTGRYHTEQESMIMASSWGDGAVELVPYALSDLGRTDLIVENWENYVWELLQNANNYVSILYDYKYGTGYTTDYVIRGIFRSFGNGSLNFSVLKWLVVLYVVFVGPVLYLILRAIKKRDWYWGAVPVTVIVGILLVYFSGRGFEVVNTRVYSVTVEKLSGQGTGNSSGDAGVTYLHCYDAGYEEWGLQLADRYDYAGPVFGSYYYDNTSDQYHYRVCREGDRVLLGMNPGRGFEDGYFEAWTSRKMETGSISSNLSVSAKWGITGTVTNETNRDFKYFAVIDDNVLYIYDALPAGETRTLEKTVYTSRQGYYDTVIESYRHDFMSEYDYEHRRRRQDYDTIAALGTGIWEVFFREDLGGTVIIGVTEDWEKAVDDNCTETAYGCLYAVQ